jgi:hypothetical protein
MGGLTGTAPKASFSTQPTILPEQQTLLDQLVGLFSGGLNQPGSPINTLATGSLAGLENLTGTPGVTSATPQQTAAETNAFNTLDNPPQINAQQAFQQGVVAPLTQSFNQTVIPTIEGQFGGSSGYQSGQGQATQQASQNFEQTLASAGSQYSLAANTANQSAILQALGLTPQIAGLPTAIGGSQISNASAGLAPLMQMLQDAIATSTGGTQTTVGVGTGGSTGLLGGLLGSPALSAGLFGNASGTFGGVFSDREMKEAVEQVGEVDGFPLYKFKYKGEPDNVRRLGVMAQDVEKRLPSAVGRDARTGYKTVDYSAVLRHVLEAA